MNWPRRHTPRRHDGGIGLLRVSQLCRWPYLGFQAARLYALRRPPRTGRRLIRSWENRPWGGRAWVAGARGRAQRYRPSFTLVMVTVRGGRYDGSPSYPAGDFGSLAARP
jgi:hypothetical protein